MALPKKVDIIYFASRNDFELEFNLGGCCTMRLLSDAPADKNLFLRSLSRAVSRSQIIIITGKISGDKSVIPTVCRAIGTDINDADLSDFGIQDTVTMPNGAIPLITQDDIFAGCVIESGPQSIIIVTDDIPLRRKIMSELVYEYIKNFGNGTEIALKGTASVSSVNENEEAENQTPDAESLNAPAEEVSEQDVPEQPSFEAETEIETETKTEKESSVIPETTLSEIMPPDTPPLSDTEMYTGDYNETKEKPQKPLRKVALTIFIIFIVAAIVLFTFIKVAEPMIVTNFCNEYAEMYGKSGLKSHIGIRDDMGMLIEYNSDTVGFLKIDGMDISLPVVTEFNKKAGYYRNHMFNHIPSFIYGTPYVKEEFAPDEYIRNIVVYGANTHNGLLFSNLSSLANIENYRKSPTIEFSTLYSKDVYKIFAVFTLDGNCESVLDRNFKDDTEFLKYINLLADTTSIYTTVDISSTDELLTLVSESDQSSTIVAARKLRKGESAEVNTAKASKSKYFDSVLYSDDFIEESGRNTVFLTPTGLYYDRFEQSYVQGLPDYMAFTDIAGTEDIPEETDTDNTNADAGTDANAGDSALTPADENLLPILTVIDCDTGNPVTGTVVDILSQVVEAEMGKEFETEALKAQAVASYGYIIASSTANGNAPSVALSTASQKVKDAVKSVAGLLPYYNNSVACTFYHRCSAGYTLSAADMWGKTIPFLCSVESSEDRNSDEYISRRAYSSEKIAEWISNEIGIDISAVPKENWFNLKYDRNGLYATGVSFGYDSTVYSGRVLRENIFTANRLGIERILRSTAYTVSYQKDSDTFLFEVRGYGNGLGMSQYGANAMAENGMKFDEILKHYYTGITIEKQ